jgi:hypothetical protein
MSRRGSGVVLVPCAKLGEHAVSLSVKDFTDGRQRSHVGASHRWRGSDCVPSDRKRRIASAFGCRERRGGVEMSCYLVNAVRAYFRPPSSAVQAWRSRRWAYSTRMKPTKYRAHVASIIKIDPAMIERTLARRNTESVSLWENYCRPSPGATDAKLPLTSATRATADLEP